MLCLILVMCVQLWYFILMPDDCTVSLSLYKLFIHCHGYLNSKIWYNLITMFGLKEIHWKQLHHTQAYIQLFCLFHAVTSRCVHLIEDFISLYLYFHQHPFVDLIILLAHRNDSLRLPQATSYSEIAAVGSIDSEDASEATWYVK